MNVSERKSNGKASELLAVIAPSWDLVMLPNMTPMLQNKNEPKNMNKIKVRGMVNVKSVRIDAIINTKRVENRQILKIVMVCAKSHSVCVRGVVESFSNREPSLPRATVMDILEMGVKRITMEI